MTVTLRIRTLSLHIPTAVLKVDNQGVVERSKTRCGVGRGGVNIVGSVLAFIESFIGPGTTLRRTKYVMDMRFHFKLAIYSAAFLTAAEM